MMKKTLLLALAAFLFNSMTGMCQAQAETSGIGVEATATSIVIKARTVTICNAEGAVLEIFSLTGTKVATIGIDSKEKTINLSLKKGCYILKVNNVVRKVSLH